MNYLAHGYRFLDNPLKLAGTAVPDWLSVVDRQVRIRTRRVNERMDALDSADRLMAEGMLQHLRDDDVFHRSVKFMMLEAELGMRFRRIMPDPFDHRPAFLGHIVTELLLDSVISEEFPEILDNYYKAIDEVSPLAVQDLVNRLASRSTDRLADFIPRIHAARILYDYSDDRLLLGRLNQVLRRVTLPLLDEQCLDVLRESRVLLRLHGPELLQAVEFPHSAEPASDDSQPSSVSDIPSLTHPTEH